MTAEIQEACSEFQGSLGQVILASFEIPNETLSQSNTK